MYGRFLDMGYVRRSYIVTLIHIDCVTCTRIVMQSMWSLPTNRGIAALHMVIRNEIINFMNKIMRYRPCMW